MTRRLVARVLLGLAAPPVLYLALAAALGAIVLNGEFRPAPADEGVLVFVRTNGFHAEVVVPTRTPTTDWSEWFPASHMRALARPAPWVAFGWGDRDFMIATPTWHDIGLRASFVALSGLGEGAIHVEYVQRPESYRGASVRIGEDHYRRLVAALRRSFRIEAGRPVRIDAPGYFDDDAFYESPVVYTFWFTCNEWVRRVLGDAGLPVPAWSPFERTLFWHLPPTR